MPRPRNLELARRLEEIIRRDGAVPATIGVISGRLTVGLGADELELLACSDDVRKCSRRDLPAVVASGGHGATTVAATLAVMGLCQTQKGPGVGPRVLATGGIGGVHRGEHLDISADLVELARTRAIVVSSGAKAILDLPRTLELLETLGVAVIGWKTDRFPAFYTSRSGLPVQTRVDDAADVASIARAAWGLDLGHGLLVAVPPPAETALSEEEAEQALSCALQAAESSGVSGPALTPFVLDQIAKATEGRSVEANLALLENNARVGAEIAVALAMTEKVT